MFLPQYFQHLLIYQGSDLVSRGFNVRMHERIAGGNVGSRECLGVIIVYSCSSAPMACARHTENINMHGRDATRYRKPTRLLVPTHVRACSIHTHTRTQRVRTFRRYYARIYTFSASPPESVALYPYPDDRGNATPSECPTNERTPLRRREPHHPVSSPPSLSLPVVSLPLFRTSLTCGEQHRLRRL